MKRYTSWLLFFLLLFISCEEKNNLVEEGFLYISTSKDMNVVTRSAVDDEVISVAVCKAATGDTIKFFEDYAKELGSGKVQLPVGLYYVKAGTVYAGKAAFDKPFYFGIDTIEVVKATLRESEVICSLANVKVTVNYSDLLKQYFIGYKTTVSNTSGELSFEEEETRAGYFTPGKLNIVLDLVNNNGTAYKIVKEISGTKAREHYRLNFSIGETPDSPEAGGDFNVTVNEKTNDIECTLNVPVFTDDHGRNMPKIVTMPEKELSIKETNPAGALLTSEITSKNGLQVLALKFASKYFNEEKGIPAYVDLMTVNEEIRGKLIELGIAFPQLSEITTDATLDFSAMLTKLPLLDGKKISHSVTIVARDNLGQQVEESVNIEVRPNVSVTANISAWSRFAFLKITAGSPDNIIVKYKQKDVASEEEQIIQVDPATVVVNSDGDYVAECILPNLEVNTSYDCNVVADIETPVSFDFTTQEEPVIPNMDFEEWNDIYPNKEGKNMYWATGNDGVKMAGKSPNTTQVEDCQNGLHAVRMESLGDVMLAGTAAGNLFIGSFNVNMSNPASSPSFGRDYSGRPTRLIGYYKYNPADATYGSYTDEEDKDMTKDIADIYIWLKDASGKQIAYGRFNSSQKVDEYTKFEIDIKYTEKNVIPKTIAIVMSSSKYGGIFTGSKVTGKMGIGSVLYVDNLSLSFDYNEKSFK